ncbi:hypothetical protein O6H91_20G022700 [Diphasiastrum complanatum]|uniref:Uncharacterized protein n=1 Tax=Diphasiastrum complanatum TaxID=34168 RepID=A0ACC2ANL0_DIPCM|nr:hypothetical protein O6H91_20G022700 [Diphasiastrum complanatum]
MGWMQWLQTLTNIMYAMVLLGVVWEQGSWTVTGQTLLQNGDFETGPANITTNSGQEVPIVGQNALPGWKLQGTVLYVSSGGNISLPNDGHGVELGLNGQISQVFSAEKPGSPYALTFSIGQAGEKDECLASNLVNVTVSPYSQLFQLNAQFTPESWDTYAWGFVAQDITLDLVFKSQPGEVDPNVTCGPVIDTVALKEFGTIESSKGNLLLNGDFEQGPYIPVNASHGILLAPVSDISSSSLPGWSIGPSNPVKYIDSAHFHVPNGAGAVELVSPQQGAIQQNVTTVPGLAYGFSFEIGDGNDSCFGNMTIKFQAGPLTQNHTYFSGGFGGKDLVSIGFKAESTSTLVSFMSLSKHYGDGTSFCGPIIDNVMLMVASSGLRLSIMLVSCIISFTLTLCLTI